MSLKLKNLYLSEKQLDYFERESKRLKIKSSEIIRRALDEYIEKRENKNATKWDTPVPICFWIFPYHASSVFSTSTIFIVSYFKLKYFAVSLVLINY